MRTYEKNDEKYLVSEEKKKTSQNGMSILTISSYNPVEKSAEKISFGDENEQEKNKHVNKDKNSVIFKFIS